jgi:hypothetical protein
VRIELTNHAIERFLERFPLVAGSDPEANLLSVAGRAVLLRERTARGHDVYQWEEIRLVCDTAPGKLVVITVLHKSHGSEQGRYGAEALAEARAETLGRLTLEAERLRTEAERALKIAGHLQSAHARVLRAIRSLTE